MEEYMLPCLNRKYLGFECMGCGLQRSIALLLRGEFVDAFYMYPALYPLILLFGSIALNQFIDFKYLNKSIIILAIITVSTMIISYIIKMSH